MESKIIRYDGSWEGLLTAIFELFEYKINVEDVIPSDAEFSYSMFSSVHEVISNSEKAERVKSGLMGKIGSAGVTELWHVFLSELPKAPLLIVETAVYYFKSNINARSNYGHKQVLEVKQIVKSVSRERHRMKAFVRFQKLRSNQYFAFIEPDFNVLPLIEKHFKDRYADQEWIIYDMKRNYGLYYDLKEVHTFTFTDDQALSQQSISIHWDDAEDLYSELWRRYFNSVNIRERKNTKLHLQHVPKRYWKYLNEKA